MGVLACDRKGCDSIMCSVLVDNMYICYDCQKEFEDIMEENGHTEEIKEREILQKLQVFMSTEKMGNGGNDKLTISEFFNKYAR